MKRSTKTLVHAMKLQTERDKVFAENQAKILNIVLDIQSTMLRMSTQFDMRRKIMIDEFIPIKSDLDMRYFLDKTDGQFMIRREEFENYIYCVVTNNQKLKRPFETHLLGAVFRRDYISSHKWPGPK